MDPCPAAGGARRHSAPRRPEEALQAGGAGALQTGCGGQSAGCRVHWGQFAAMFRMHTMSTEGTAPRVPALLATLQHRMLPRHPADSSMLAHPAAALATFTPVPALEKHRHKQNLG